MKLDIKIMREQFKPSDILPEYKTGGSAGMDLKAAIDEPLTLAPGERKLVPTGIAIHIPGEDKVGLVYPRSGLSSKKGIGLANSVGVIDSDYRGEIFCPLINHSKEEYVLEPLERMAQLVIAPIHIMDLNVVDSLEDSERGAGGFGSTGK